MSAINDAEQRAILERLKNDFPFYAQQCLTIRAKTHVNNKSNVGNLQKLKLNRAQLYLHEQAEKQKREKGYVRIIVLKGRQQGISTYIEARFMHLSTFNFGYRTFILTHDSEATSNIFDMARRYYNYLPPGLQPKTSISSSKEMLFDNLQSGYKVGTAGNKGVGRSQTIQLFHGSEVAFWEHAAEHAKGALQAVPLTAGTEVFLESTANSKGNFFYHQWQQAEANDSDYLAVFIPWFWQPEYSLHVTNDMQLNDEEIELKLTHGLTNGQLAWRRMKIREFSDAGKDGIWSFRQEYPCTSIEAFDVSDDNSYFRSKEILAARKADEVPRIGPKIMGVDVARGGNDRSVLVYRQGREIYGIKKFRCDAMALADEIFLQFQLEQPDYIHIDLGFAPGVHDRLLQMGISEHVLRGVHFGGAAMDKMLYRNKRSEMYAELKKWLNEPPVKLPDDDELHADLLNIQTSRSSTNDKLLFESKDSMRERGIRSPDLADACVLTFAFPSVKLNNQFSDYDVKSSYRAGSFFGL